MQATVVELRSRAAFRKARRMSLLLRAAVPALRQFRGPAKRAVFTGMNNGAALEAARRLDLYIIAKTVRVILRGENAH